MLVGVQGFEPWTPCSQSRCATGLRYTPKDRNDTAHACSGQRKEMLLLGSELQLVGKPIRHLVSDFAAFRFHHHANQRLRAGRTYEHATSIA